MVGVAGVVVDSLCSDVYLDMMWVSCTAVENDCFVMRSIS